MTLKDVENKIARIDHFPNKGVIFRDITPLFLEIDTIKFIIQEMEKKLSSIDFDIIVSPESRGYLFGLPLALKTNKPFVMVRKENKLPRTKISVEYELEYGKGILEIHKGDIKPDSKILIVDDLLATGGTSIAIQNLVKKLDSKVVAQIYLIDLKGLWDKSKLDGSVFSLISY